MRDRLTLEEQAALSSGATLWSTEPVERLGIPSIRFSDGPHGLRRQPAGGTFHIEDVQDQVGTIYRLGIQDLLDIGDLGSGQLIIEDDDPDIF